MSAEEGWPRSQWLNRDEGMFRIRKCQTKSAATRGFRYRSFIGEQCGNRLRLFGEIISVRIFFPFFPHARLDALVAMKLHVAEHPRFGVDATRHPLRTILVRLQHVRVKFHAEEVGYLLQTFVRAAHQIFKLQLILPANGYVLKEPENILMTDCPDHLGQFAPAERVCVAKENLIEFCVFKRTNHATRVPQQMYVESVLEVDLSALQDARMKSIGRCFIDQRAVSDPLLHEPVEFFGRKVALFKSAHDTCGFFSAAAFDLHDGAQCAFEPEAERAREGLLSLCETVEREEF